MLKSTLIEQIREITGLDHFSEEIYKIGEIIGNNDIVGAFETVIDDDELQALKDNQKS